MTGGWFLAVAIFAAVEIGGAILYVEIKHRILWHQQTKRIRIQWAELERKYLR